MDENRSATDTIIGYFYQFDLSILSLLSTSDNDEIMIEGIEDIDIRTASDTTTIQCKYYSKTEYNHSVIKKAIRYMLTHFSEVKDGKRAKINYLLCGHYKSGQEKIPNNIDVDFLKKKFLTHTTSKNVKGTKVKTVHYHHQNLGMDDSDLNNFLSHLKIDVNAKEFYDQYRQILDELKRHFTCSDISAEFFYYNNALSVIKDLSIQQNPENRKISKSIFLKRIDKKSVLFNEWFIQLKSVKVHYSALRKEYFTVLNISPFERFFLINVESESVTTNEISEIIHEISRKWSKTSKRESAPFCPYVLINGISNVELIRIKSQIHKEGLNLNDGHTFLGSDFCTEQIIKEANYHNGIKIKILNNFADMMATLSRVRKRKEVYEFYVDKYSLGPISSDVKHTRIQVEQLTDIKKII